MAGFRNIQELVDAENSGATRTFSFRKTPSQGTITNVWFDLSMSAGNPVPNYYASSPLISVPMRQSTDGGMYHGSDVYPATKYLRKSMIMASSATGLPMPFYLLDYLMYYPFIDEGTVDEQFMTNSASLPRYTDGEGVQIMCVSVAPRTGGQRFVVKYTNSQGVSGRVTQAVYQNNASPNGSIITSMQNNLISNILFIPLQGKDTGVRYIESVTMLGTDVGLFTLVLVKPIATMSLVEQTAPVEIDYIMNQGMGMPVIKDDAYLNMVCNPFGSIQSINYLGTLTFTWN